MKGKLLVFEGIDGSGKTTQVEILAKFLAEKNIPFEVISFPRYEDNLYGKLIRRYLEGEFGDLGQVNPYLMALSYAGDRALAKSLIENWLNIGKIVIANRYVSASKAHLGANMQENEREGFMSWIDKLEYETNGMPKPDLTILLDIDAKTGQENVKDKQTDLHEDNIDHLQNARKIYLELSRAENNWKVVNCMTSGRMKSKEDIHKDLFSLLNL